MTRVADLDIRKKKIAVTMRLSRRGPAAPIATGAVNASPDALAELIRSPDERRGDGSFGCVLDGSVTGAGRHRHPGAASPGKASGQLQGRTIDYTESLQLSCAPLPQGRYHLKTAGSPTALQHFRLVKHAEIDITTEILLLPKRRGRTELTRCKALRLSRQPLMTTLRVLARALRGRSVPLPAPLPSTSGSARSSQARCPGLILIPAALLSLIHRSVVLQRFPNHGELRVARIQFEGPIHSLQGLLELLQMAIGER